MQQRPQTRFLKSRCQSEAVLGVQLIDAASKGMPGKNAPGRSCVMRFRSCVKVYTVAKRGNHSLNTSVEDSSANEPPTYLCRLTRNVMGVLYNPFIRPKDIECGLFLLVMG